MLPAIPDNGASVVNNISKASPFLCDQKSRILDALSLITAPDSHTSKYKEITWKRPSDTGRRMSIHVENQDESSSDSSSLEIELPVVILKPNISSNQRSYKCCSCSQLFSKMILFEKHWRVVHLYSQSKTEDSDHNEFCSLSAKKGGKTLLNDENGSHSMPRNGTIKTNTFPWIQSEDESKCDAYFGKDTKLGGNVMLSPTQIAIDETDIGETVEIGFSSFRQNMLIDAQRYCQYNTASNTKNNITEAENTDMTRSVMVADSHISNVSNTNCGRMSVNNCETDNNMINYNKNIMGITDIFGHSNSKKTGPMFLYHGGEVDSECDLYSNGSTYLTEHVNQSTHGMTIDETDLGQTIEIRISSIDKNTDTIGVNLVDKSKCDKLHHIARNAGSNKLVNGIPSVIVTVEGDEALQQVMPDGSRNENNSHLHLYENMKADSKCSDHHNENTLSVKNCGVTLDEKDIGATTETWFSSVGEGMDFNIQQMQKDSRFDNKTGIQFTNENGTNENYMSSAKKALADNDILRSFNESQASPLEEIISDVQTYAEIESKSTDDSTEDNRLIKGIPCLEIKNVSLDRFTAESTGDCKKGNKVTINSQSKDCWTNKPCEDKLGSRPQQLKKEGGKFRPNEEMTNVTPKTYTDDDGNSFVDEFLSALDAPQSPQISEYSNRINMKVSKFDKEMSPRNVSFKQAMHKSFTANELENTQNPGQSRYELYTLKLHEKKRKLNDEDETPSRMMNLSYEVNDIDSIGIAKCISEENSTSVTAAGDLLQGQSVECNSVLHFARNDEQLTSTSEADIEVSICYDWEEASCKIDKGHLIHDVSLLQQPAETSLVQPPSNKSEGVFGKDESYEQLLQDTYVQRQSTSKETEQLKAEVHHLQSTCESLEEVDINTCNFDAQISRCIQSQGLGVIIQKDADGVGEPDTTIGQNAVLPKIQYDRRNQHKTLFRESSQGDTVHESKAENYEITNKQSTMQVDSVSHDSICHSEAVCGKSSLDDIIDKLKKSCECVAGNLCEELTIRKETKARPISSDISNVPKLMQRDEERITYKQFSQDKTVPNPKESLKDEFRLDSSVAEIYSQCSSDTNESFGEEDNGVEITLIDKPEQETITEKKLHQINRRKDNLCEENIFATINIEDEFKKKLAERENWNIVTMLDQRHRELECKLDNELPIVNSESIMRQADIITESVSTRHKEAKSELLKENAKDIISEKKLTKMDKAMQFTRNSGNTKNSQIGLTEQSLEMHNDLDSIGCFDMEHKIPTDINCQEPLVTAKNPYDVSCEKYPSSNANVSMSFALRSEKHLDSKQTNKPFEFIKRVKVLKHENSEQPFHLYLSESDSEVTSGTSDLMSENEGSAVYWSDVARMEEVSTDRVYSSRKENATFNLYDSEARKSDDGFRQTESSKRRKGSFNDPPLFYEILNVKDKSLKRGYKRHFLCRICNTKFTNLQLMKMHHNQKHVKSPCNQCAKGYVTKANLKAHQKAKHANKKAGSRSETKQDFHSLGGVLAISPKQRAKDDKTNENKSKKMIKKGPKMQHHSRRISGKGCKNPLLINTNSLFHSKGKKHLCTVCGEKFSTLTQASQHCLTQKKTEKKYYKCADCSWQTEEKHKLNEHVLQIHKGKASTEPFSCFACKKTFQNEMALSKHVRSQHGKRKLEPMAYDKTRWDDKAVERSVNSSLNEKSSMAVIPFAIVNDMSPPQCFEPTETVRASVHVKPVKQNVISAWEHENNVPGAVPSRCKVAPLSQPLKKCIDSKDNIMNTSTSFGNEDPVSFSQPTEHNISHNMNETNIRPVDKENHINWNKNSTTLEMSQVTLSTPLQKDCLFCQCQCLTVKDALHHSLKHSGVNVEDAEDMFSRSDILHTEINTFFCQVCNKEFSEISDLADHIVRHKIDEKNPITCLSCFGIFNVLEELVFHLKDCLPVLVNASEVLNKSSILEIPSYKKDLSSAIHENAELTFTDNQCITCAICSHKFCNIPGFLHHLKVSCSGILGFKCHECNQTFDMQKNLFSHLNDCECQSSLIREKNSKKKSSQKDFLPQKKHVLQSTANRNKLVSVNHAVHSSQRKRFWNKFSRMEKYQSRDVISNCTSCGSFHLQTDMSLCNWTQRTLVPELLGCEFCDRRFKTAAQLKVHKSLHRQFGAYKCAVCQTTFSSSKEYMKHCSSHNTANNDKSQSGETLTCDEGEQERENDEDSSNLKPELGKITQEDQLEEQYKGKQKNNPMNTKFSAASDEGIVSCRYCRKCFSCERVLQGHLEVRHNIMMQQNYCCKICLEECRTLEELHKHNHLHYACEDCGRSFTHRHRLMDHYAKCKHDSLYLYKCKTCLRVFKRINKIELHLKRQKHPNGYDILKADNISLCTIKKGTNFDRDDLDGINALHHSKFWYKCKSCSKIFKNIQGIKLHLKKQCHQEGYDRMQADSVELWKSKGSWFERKDVANWYKCKSCLRVYRSENGIKSHMKEQSHKDGYSTVVPENMTLRRTWKGWFDKKDLSSSHSKVLDAAGERDASTTEAEKCGLLEDNPSGSKVNDLRRQNVIKESKLSKKSKRRRNSKANCDNVAGKGDSCEPKRKQRNVRKTPSTKTLSTDTNTRCRTPKRTKQTRKTQGK